MQYGAAHNIACRGIETCLEASHLEAACLEAACLEVSYLEDVKVSGAILPETFTAQPTAAA